MKDGFIRRVLVDRLRETEERLPLDLRVERSQGNERARKRSFGVSPQSQRLVADLEEASCTLAGGRVDDLVARVEPVLLRGEPERVFAVVRFDELESADRLRVLDQLRDRHRESREELPPHRLRFTAVVVE